MNNSISKRRAYGKSFSIISIVLVVIIGTILIGIPASAKAYASMEETSETVRVFVGDIKRAPDDYIEKRMEYVEEIAHNEPTKIVQAVVGFHDYYTVDDVVEIMESYEAIVNRVYMWPEGETGRLSLYVDNGKITDGIEKYIKQVEEYGLDDDEQSLTDYERFLNGEYKIFAVTISSTSEVLHKLISENDCVSYADIKYNEDAEEYAAMKDKALHYIELPSKPDGAA